MSLVRRERPRSPINTTSRLTIARKAHEQFRPSRETRLKPANSLYHTALCMPAEQLTEQATVPASSGRRCACLTAVAASPCLCQPAAPHSLSKS